MFRYLINSLIIVAVLGTSMAILSKSLKSVHGKQLFIVENAPVTIETNDSTHSSYSGSGTALPEK